MPNDFKSIGQGLFQFGTGMGSLGTLLPSLLLSLHFLLSLSPSLNTPLLLSLLFILFRFTALANGFSLHAGDIILEAIGHSLNWLPNDLDTGYLENFYFTCVSFPLFLSYNELNFL